MGKILFMEKPEWVSWEDICECIHASHQTNKKWGFEMLNSNLTGAIIAERLQDGKCFVAIENQKVVGTASLKILKKSVKSHIIVLMQFFPVIVEPMFILD